MPDFHADRHAGVLVPLFSIPSSGSWGVGEIPDLARLAGWLDSAGLDFVQLLPVNEMQEGQSSPYSALSAMAIDPVFLAPGDVPEFAEWGGEQALEAHDREQLARVRDSRSIDFRVVRALKSRALHASFAVFRERHLGTGSERDRQFHEFRVRARWWLDDYALFRALHDEHQACYWRDWEPGLRSREPVALDQARARLGEAIFYYEYVQWLADEQWQRTRRECGCVGIFGDFPFTVSGHSADVWSRQHEFRIDASVGVPPDPLSGQEAQSWGLPAYRWEISEPGDFEWLRLRAHRCTELYDGFRLDHLVGFYRMFFRDPDGQGHFSPAGEPAQLRHGERLMRLFLASGARIIVEDLGVVPDFVRESLSRLRIPGLKVMRWERKWQDEGQPFRDPADYPVDSVAMSSTHDTETMGEWWDNAGPDERRSCAEIPGLRESGCDPDAPFSSATRDALLRAVFGAASDLAIVSIQDVFGWRVRVNTPGVISHHNWTWRLPWPVDAFGSQPDAQERAGFLHLLSDQTHRR